MLGTRKWFDSLQLKMIAACAMLIDHTGHVFFPAEIYIRCIGRLAFPIFAFLIAVGYQKTRSVHKYALRLFIFALIAQLPFIVMINAQSGIPFNVIFTLLFGLITIYFIDRFAGPVGFILSLILILFAEFGGFDHGAFGVIMVIAFYYTLNNKTARNLWASILIILFTMSYILQYGFNNYSWIIISFYIFTIPLLALYNEKPGIKNKFTRWFFYAFYPGHIILLLLIGFFI